jgi:hypothetical protein
MRRLSVISAAPPLRSGRLGGRLERCTVRRGEFKRIGEEGDD